ncbi:hypothetical protein E3N88_01853 [Mikania micrantha]|uniref:Uncharacterized protein n=1 Tax=Mikania micrantha TaxID=192012 RepID=A0A5N6Q3Z1_9ASTR|nr:hypothetical protein E3N88_01853 [Mikania micrantha]
MVKVVEHNSDIKIQGKRQGGVPVLEKKKTPLQMAKSGVEVYEHQTICSAHMVKRFVTDHTFLASPFLIPLGLGFFEAAPAAPAHTKGNILSNYRLFTSTNRVVKDGVSDQARSGSESDGENRIERTSDAGES